uniref:Uncharacterized protein n=1 Tax=Sphaerodactylus townsendi TaxID=933632 RepID=A0ACB8FFW1_9SAUR
MFCGRDFMVYRPINTERRELNEVPVELMEGRLAEGSVGQSLRPHLAEHRLRRDSKRAPLSCFRKVNMRGDRTGNCGEGNLGYKKCEEEYVASVEPSD